MIGASKPDTGGGFSYDGSGRSIMVDRFFNIYEVLSNLKEPEQIGRVIITDVRDVVFQNNPTVWLASSPAVFGEKVYFGGIDYNIYCLDAKTGAKQWEYKTGQRVWASPVVHDNAVYIGSRDYVLYCLDAQTGKKIWVFKTDYYIVASPVITGNYLYFRSWDNRLYCLDAKTGSKVWDLRLLGSKSSPAVCGGYLYVGGDDHKLHCFKAAEGDTGCWPMFKYNPERTSAVNAG